MTAFGAPVELIDPVFLMSDNAITQIGNAPRRIDLLGSIDGLTFGEVRAGAVRGTIEGQRLLVIGLDELRINKKAAGRPKDKQDLAGLSRAR